MSRRLLYGRTKCLSLACAILCTEYSIAQTPWQAAPATPAPLNPPNLITPSSPQPTQSSPTTTSQPPVVNRYTQQVQRPPLIPFDPNKTPVYNATELPAPNAKSTVQVPQAGRFAPPADAVNSLIGAVPTQPTNVASRTAAGLPGANQLLPRTPAGFNPNSPATFTGGANFLDQPLVANPNVPIPKLAEAASTMKLTAFDQVGGHEQPQITSDLWSARLVAVVGSERVLAGDMAAIVEPIILENRAKLQSKKSEIDARNSLIRQLLPQYVEMKALQQEFFRDIAGNVPPKELQKKQDEVMTRASKAFYEKFVPVELNRKYKVESLAELEEKLQENGLSLSIMKNHFLMQVLAMQLEDKYIAETFEISPAEILAYYNANQEKWQIPARAKWRQLTVRFDRHEDRTEADNLIRAMGNEIAQGGKPFEAVARDSSEGFTADEGGMHDWTNKGSLKSTVIDEAIFSLPTRRLSQIIEDEIGLHILEVVQREEARTQDMSEIQAEIRKKLSDDIRKQKLLEFRKKVLARVPIRTLWPDDIPGSRLLEEK